MVYHRSTMLKGFTHARLACGCRVAFREGVEMISKQLNDILDRRGVAEINPVGQAFDPERHEAVQRVEESGHEPGTVAFVLLKGYMSGDKLLRPALVGVAVDPGDDSDNGIVS